MRESSPSLTRGNRAKGRAACQEQEPSQCKAVARIRRSAGGNLRRRYREPDRPFPAEADVPPSGREAAEE